MPRWGKRPPSPSERAQLAKAIRRGRAEMRLSVVDAAAKVGVAVGTWQSWEAGRHWPRCCNAEELASVVMFGTSARTLLFRKCG